MRDKPCMRENRNGMAAEESCHKCSKHWQGLCMILTVVSDLRISPSHCLLYTASLQYNPTKLTKLINYHLSSSYYYSSNIFHQLLTHAILCNKFHFFDLITWILEQSMSFSRSPNRTTSWYTYLLTCHITQHSILLTFSKISVWIFTTQIINYKLQNLPNYHFKIQFVETW